MAAYSFCKSLGLWLYESRVPSRVHRRHQHTIGEVVCAWFGIIPVMKRENGDAALHQLSIVLHLVYERGRMDWRVNTVNASRPSTRAPSEHHWWVCTCSIWANSMIGMRKLSGCQCRNMWQLIGGKESLASTGPMCIFTPRRPCRPCRWVLDDVSRA